MLFGVVGCGPGGVDGVTFGTQPPERVEELGVHDFVRLVVPVWDLTERLDHRCRRCGWGGCGGGEVAANDGRGRSARSLGPLLGHRCDHVADRHRLPDLRLVDRSGAEAVGESLRGDTDGGGFRQPS
jgi:hypothetical protein